MTISKFSTNRSNYFFTDDPGCRSEAASGIFRCEQPRPTKAWSSRSKRKYDEAIKEFTAAIEATPEERQGLLEPRHGLSRACRNTTRRWQISPRQLRSRPKDEMGYIERGPDFRHAKAIHGGTGGFE